MKKWFCPDCGHRTETKDNIVFMDCGYCGENMEEE